MNLQMTSKISTSVLACCSISGGCCTNWQQFTVNFTVNLHYQLHAHKMFSSDVSKPATCFDTSNGCHLQAVLSVASTAPLEWSVTHWVNTHTKVGRIVCRSLNEFNTNWKINVESLDINLLTVGWTVAVPARVCADLVRALNTFLCLLDRVLSEFYENCRK